MPDLWLVKHSTTRYGECSLFESKIKAKSIGHKIPGKNLGILETMMQEFIISYLKHDYNSDLRH